MIYLILNLAFCSTLLLLLPSIRKAKRRPLLLATAIVCLLTAIFDPMLIALGMFGYNEQKLIGITFFGAPIEDFFYPAYAGVLMAALWEKLGGEDVDDN